MNVILPFIQRKSTMHADGLSVAVISSGKVLRETQESMFSKAVHLPFDSEYAIRIKNDTAQRAVATISIDGTDILGGHTLVVPAYGHIDIDRFICDGNLKTGKKLKFVSVDHKDVQDAASPENGKVRIGIRKEMVLPRLGYVSFGDDNTWKRRLPWRRVPYESEYEYDVYASWSETPASTAYRSVGAGADRTSSVLRGVLIPMSMTASIGAVNVGATVEGDYSAQSFGTTSVGQLELHETVFEFAIRGMSNETLVQSAVFVQDTRNVFCVECGSKTKTSNKYCPKCGTKLEKEFV